jgi:hypothetical protein
MENQSGRYDLNLGYWRKHSSLVDWKTRWRRQQGTCRLLQFIPEEKNCLVGGLQSADFFRGDNKEGIDARNEVCMLWPSSVFICSRIGCQIGCQLHQTLNSKPHQRILETYHENHQSYLAPFCVCVCVHFLECVCPTLSEFFLFANLTTQFANCNLGWITMAPSVLFFNFGVWPAMRYDFFWHAGWRELNFITPRS